MQTKKNFRKIAFISLLGILGLTACNDEIKADPKDYNNPIIENSEYGDVFNNYLSTVYDAIREGNLASDVLNELLYKFAVSAFGEYSAVTAPANFTGTTLKAAYISAKSTNKDVAKQFINDHKAFWSVDEDGNRRDDVDREIARLVEKYESIEKRIAEAMYKKISSGSYSTRNLFSEKDFLYSLRTSMNSVADPSSITTTTLTTEDTLLYPEIEDYQVFDTVEVDGNDVTLLHRANYQSNFETTADEKTGTNTYVEDELIPEIYRQLLVEQYILDESYNTLGRSYARKINVVAIKANNEYPTAARYLMQHFVRNVVSAAPDIAEISGAVTLDNFKSLSNAWNGAFTYESDGKTIVVDEDVSLLADAGLTKTTTEGGIEYYEGTAYGDVLKDYDKIKDDPKLNDESIESTFTGSNTYTKEIGLEMKKNENRIQDYTTTGWFIKSSGLADLPDAIKSRLFNILVANAVNDTAEHDRFVYADGDWTYNAENDFNNYVAKINGKYYLKVASTEKGADPRDDVLFYDNDSSTFYVVQIEEAVSAGRLNKTGSDNYAAIRTDEVMEEIVNEVVKLVADNDSYKTLSTKHWLEESGLVTHDQVIYDYFKDNYPELFEDDD